MAIALTGRASGTARWEDLAARLPLPSGAFPLPFPDGSLDVDVLIHVDPSGAAPGDFDIPPELLTGTPTAFLMLTADYALPPELSFGLPGIRPDPSCRVTFVAAFATEAEAQARLTDTAAISGALRFETSIAIDGLQLPDELNWIQMRLGDADGRVTLRLTARADSNGAMSIVAEARELGSLSLWLPELPSPEPAIDAWLSRLTGTIDWDGEKLGGVLTLAGGFHFHPRLAGSGVPIAPFLAPLLDGIDLRGELTAEIDLGALEVRLIGTFENAGVEIDLLQLFQSVARGSPSIGDGAAGSGLPTFGFGLARIALRLSRTPSFSLQFIATIGDFQVPAYLAVSTREVSCGIGWAEGDLPAISIPFVMPLITREMLEPVVVEFRDRMLASAVRLNASPAERAAAEERYNLAAKAVLDAVELLSGVLAGGPGRFTATEQNGTWTFDPAIPPPGGDDLPIKIAVGGTSDKRELVVAAWVDGKWHLLVARPRIELKDISIRIPLQSPRDIQIGGAAHFVADGPLSALKDVWLRLALSTDMIYFSIETPAGNPATITIPELAAGYGTAELSIGQFLIGFSYTRRSLAVAFAGGVKLPPRLVDDLDTSEYGAGIRLPVHAQVMFRFDLMVITIGQVVIPIPMIQFNLDFRRNASTALLDASVCAPAWDGLQVIVKDAVRVGLKRLSYSPIFGCYCSSNSDFAGAVSIGTPDTGFSAVVENGYWAYGLDSAAAIMFAPILGLPFTDNACVHVGLGGFGLNINVQRPIPTPSPFTVFELAALLSDPLYYEVAPHGDLADAVRFSITDAWIDLPEPVEALFPAVRGAMHQPLDLTINLGTFIKLLQIVGRVASPAIQLGIESVQTLRQQPLPNPAQTIAQALTPLAGLDVRKETAHLLAALPPMTRSISLAASFGPFDATAVLVLADVSEIRAMLDAADRPEVKPTDAVRAGAAWNPDEMAAFQPRFKAGFDAAVAIAPQSAPLLPERFGGLAGDDFEAALAMLGDDAGVGALIAADVRAFGTQEFAFIGLVTGDGHFALASSIDVENLQIALAGITVPFPLKMHGRLQLYGKRTAARTQATIVAEGSERWQLAPRVLLELGMEDPKKGKGSTFQPVRVELSDPRQFSLRGLGRLTVFDLSLTGSVDVGPSHCMVTGHLEFVVTVLALPGNSHLGLDMTATAQIGPGARWAIDAEGTLTLLGKQCAGVRARITERSADVEGRFTATGIRIASGVMLDVNLFLRGQIDLERPANRFPRFALSGDGTMSCGLLGFAIDGGGNIASTDAGLVRVGAHGKLMWRGREWWNGSIEVTTTTLRITGQTSIAVSIPAAPGISAALVVQLTVGGAFGFSLSPFGITDWAISGECLIGIKLAGERVTPVAALAYKSPTGSFEIPLIRIQGLPSIAAPTVTLPNIHLEDSPLKLIYMEKTETNAGITTTVQGFRVKWDNVELGRLGGGDDQRELRAPQGVAFDGNRTITATVPTLPHDFDIKLVWLNHQLQLKVGTVPIPLGL